AARCLVDVASAITEHILRHAADRTNRGADIDDHQVHVERVAYLATQVRAAADLVAYAERLAAAGKPDPAQERMALAYAAEVAHALRAQLDAAWRDFALTDAEAAPLHAPEVTAAIRAGL